MILNLLVSLAQMSASQPGLEISDPPRAICQPIGRAEGALVTMYALVCPDDVPQAEALQEHALAVSNQVGVPISVPRGASLETEFPFVLVNGQWRLERDRVAVVKGRPRYAPEGAARGYEARCHIRFELTTLGRATDIQAFCETFRHGRPARLDAFEPAAIEYTEQSIFAFELGTAPGCVEFTLIYRFSEDAETEPPWPSATPEEAPRCAAGEAQDRSLTDEAGDLL